MRLLPYLHRILLLLVAIFYMAAPLTTHAQGLAASAGPYRIHVTTDPSRIPVGPAKVVVRVTDSAGQAVTGVGVTVLAAMPAMPMGEREETAQPVLGQPGSFIAPARFQMSGDWTLTVYIHGPAGAGMAVLPVRTGQETAGIALIWRALGGFALLLFLCLLIIRLRPQWQSGWRPDPRPVANRQVLGGVALLAVIYFGGQYAIAHYRRPGAMSVIEAQAMDMTVMKPPVGAAPVAVVPVKHGSVDATVRYTGSVVPFVEQDLAPRVTGWIRWMPFYPGDRVKKGQLLARLDTDELQSRVSERRAGQTMAEHAHGIAKEGARQARAQAAVTVGALAEVRQQQARAQAMVRQAEGQLAQVKDEQTATSEERVQADADLASAQSGLADAEAGVAAARADREYWRAEIQRMGQLLKSGAVSGEEYQREQAQAENSEARARQAEAKRQQSQAAVTSAQSKIRKADAMIAAAAARVNAASAGVEQARADAGAAAAKITQVAAEVRAAGAAAEVASHEIEHTHAGVAEAEAMLNTASVVQRYTEIRSEVDGVITQRLISPGVLVNPGTAILKIAQIDPIRLQANVAEEDLAAVRVGNRVRARVDSSSGAAGRVIEARVTAVFPAADPVARTGIVEAVVPNAGRRLRPGEYVSMEISTARRRDSLVIPAAAVTQVAQRSDDVLALDQAPAVWVMVRAHREVPVYLCSLHPHESRSSGPGKCPICGWDLAEQATGGGWHARRVRVQLGATDGRYTEVVSGLGKGDRVIYQGYEPLKEGDPVVAARWGREGPAELPPATGEPVLAGVQYTCPMHPEVMSNKPGECPKCGMKLVPKNITYACPMHPEVKAKEPGVCPKCQMQLVPQVLRAADGKARGERVPAQDSASASKEDRVVMGLARGQFYCPMHPDVHSNDPSARCAKCGGMKLLPRPVAKK